MGYKLWTNLSVGQITKSIGVALTLAFACASSFAQLNGGKQVTFEALAANGKQLILTGVLFEARSEARSAVVLLHSSGGMSEAVQGHYGRELSEAGYLVLAVDSFKPRGIVRTVDDQSQAGSIDMALDGLYARQYLATNYATLRKFAIMGFSKGGLAAMFTADRTFHPKVLERFDAHVAAYPSCAFLARNPKPTGPLLILLGEKDTYAGVEPCIKWSSAFEVAGGKANVKVYPDALHSFDGGAVNGPVYLSRGESFADCLVYVEDDGQWSYQGKSYPTQLSTYPDLSRSCVKRGVYVGGNAKAKLAATADVKTFLATVMN